MMEHNLEDSLKLESAMGEMDFENPGDVVNQSDITLESGGNMQMEFENIEEQQMLMDTGNEEIIGFMGDQFTLQQYSIPDDQSSDVGAMVDTSQMNIMSSQSETLIDLQFEPQTMVASSRQDIIHQPKYISVKAAPPLRAKKPEATPLASVPRQVAIAPKPPRMVHVAPPKSLPGKHYAIAPKPVSLIANRTPSFKKVSLAGTVQGNMKGTSVLAQIGKQLVMVPSGSGQKIKFVAANTGMSSVQYVRSSSDSAQLIETTSKAISGTQTTKPIMAKVVVQGQQNDSSNQPAVITKLLPSSGAGAAGATRYVMQQKTVPINIGGNKLLLASPTKQGIKFPKKQQIIAIKSPTPKLMPATSQATTTKKVVITANPNQNVILKTTAPPKPAQINKDGNVLVQGQRSQLHQISVPGKGIQYIRLITNPTPSVAKPAVKQQTSALTIPKNFVLTDTKGNVIQMTAEKIMVQPPPLVRNDAPNKLAPQKKLVRIAPLNTKVTQPSTQPARSSQSLLAPRSPTAETSTSLDNVSELLDNTLMANIKQDESEEQGHAHAREVDVDTKDSLRALVASTLADEPEDMVNFHEIEVEYERQPSPTDEEDSNSMEPDGSKSMQHPVIVIPPNYIKTQNQTSHDTSGNSLNDSKDMSSIIDVDGEMIRPYDMSPQPSQSLSETEFASTELDLRPRKACNCTKSQCLKLYCDCFANGEFCNRCNCNNCHNNLENEELRQKAIRACLDRNPNAFRPKIGKAKSGGPEIVRRHNKGCNCKRSGCLKNYCECYEAKIACTATCKCVGCRNVEETLQRLRLPRVRDPRAARDPRAVFRPPPLDEFKQPCSFMTSEVIEAVCQCLVAAAAGDAEDAPPHPDPDPDLDPVGDVIDEFARCLQDIISASYQAIPLTLMDEGQA